MKKVVFFIILVIMTSFSFAQTFKGTLLDKNKKTPIEGAHVYLQNSKGGALSNEKGKFILTLPTTIAESDTIYFSHIGYKTTTLAYAENIKNRIYLLANIEEIDEVSLLNKKKLKSRLHYTKLTSMENSVHSFGSFLVDNKIYVFGGDASNRVNALAQAASDYPFISNGNSPFTSMKEHLYKARGYLSIESYSENLQVYDIKNNNWNIVENKFRKRAFHNANYYDEKIIILGGARLSVNKLFEYLDDKIEVYDLNYNSIKIDNTNPHQAVDFVSLTYKDDLIVLGGSIKKKKNGKKEYSNKVHLYNMKSGLWYELGPMPIAKETSGVLINDKIYLIGGFNNSPLTTIESYDLISGKWKKEGNLFGAISKPALTHSDHIIYFYEDGNMYTFNILTKELNEYLIHLTLQNSELFYANNKLFLLGGYRDGEFSRTPSSSLYSIDLNEFKKTRVFKSKVL